MSHSESKFSNAGKTVAPIPNVPKSVHYRCADFISTRKKTIINKNSIIKHRNKLVRQARENGKFYLEGGVLSM